jgi:hypothetical protein
MEGVFKNNEGGCKDEFLTLVNMSPAY